MLILLDQVGKIRAYKLVNEKLEGIYNGGIIYKQNGSYSVKNFDSDPNNDCGAGINLATLPFCIRYWRKGYKILIAEFTAKDIVAIPIGNEKFRVSKCKIVGEKDLKGLCLED